MKILRLDLSHVDDLVPLFDSYRQFYRKPSDLAAADAFLRERLSLNEAIVFGAFDDYQLIGFTLLYPLFSSTRMKSFYLLNDLFVLPECRNKSVGKALLNKCKQFATEQGKAGLMLETEKTNDVGNHLYPANGFQLIADSNFYFWENSIS
ncbi:MAG: GNAT family N-acetyltransferase [Saprospiraceae bacterium]